MFRFSISPRADDSAERKTSERHLVDEIPRVVNKSRRESQEKGCGRCSDYPEMSPQRPQQENRQYPEQSGCEAQGELVLAKCANSHQRKIIECRTVIVF